MPNHNDSVPFQIGACGRSRAAEILEIFNEAIANSTALWEYQPRTLDDMESWFHAKELRGFPVLGAITPAGRLAGFASYGSFRNFPGYKYTVEHSLYIHKDFRSQGLGRQLLRAVVGKAAEADLHVLVAAIDGSNEHSKVLHLSEGFEYCGKISEAGFKFGRWLDVEFYQLRLKSPRVPTDG